MYLPYPVLKSITTQKRRSTFRGSNPRRDIRRKSSASVIVHGDGRHERGVRGDMPAAREGLRGRNRHVEARCPRIRVEHARSPPGGGGDDPRTPTRKLHPGGGGGDFGTHRPGWRTHARAEVPARHTACHEEVGHTRCVRGAMLIVATAG